MKSQIIVFRVLTICAAMCFFPASGEQQIDPSGQPLAVAIEKAIDRVSADNVAEHELWPGFDPVSVPLAVYDGQKTYLFRHPAPPEPFRPAGGLGPNVYVMEGRNENVSANTNSEIGGVPAATILLDPAHSQGSARELAAVAIHEAFHVYQRKHHPGWIGNEADLFVYPTNSAKLLALRRQETRALGNALQAKESKTRSCWALSALTLRDKRFAEMAPTSVAYERGTELNEGLAAYVQMRVEGKKTVELPPAGFKPGAIRQRAYVTGPALALLLDRVSPGWQASFESNDKQTLDGLLLDALGKGRACHLQPALVSEMQDQARQDVAALTQERMRLLADFQTQPGWRIIVREENGNWLWPQGFDPLNVERLGNSTILHTRFLKVGNDSGQIEVFNLKSLTHGAGSHPLFNGIDRMEVSVLQKPEIVQDGEYVKIGAPGVSGQFKRASVSTSGHKITITLRR